MPGIEIKDALRANQINTLFTGACGPEEARQPLHATLITGSQAKLLSPAGIFAFELLYRRRIAPRGQA